MAVRFIPDKLVPIIQLDQLRRYGGTPGIRDVNLLHSALAQPKMTIGRKFLHKTIFDKAAAYGFHVCRNHPFIDGNKRVAFALMFVFLRVNGMRLASSEDEAYALTMELAKGDLSKTALARWLKAHTSKIPPQSYQN